MTLALTVNERSQAMLLHDRPFATQLVRLEFNRSGRRLTVVLPNGVARQLGVDADPAFAKYLESAEDILVVLMQDGKPIEGDYYPLLVY